MKSEYLQNLKDYLEYYSRYGFSEFDIIEMYATDKNLETEFSNLAIKLTASNLRKEKERFSDANFIILSTNEKHLGSYTYEENRFINSLLISLAFYPERLLKDYESDIRLKIPQMLMPSWCFIDLIAIINYKYQVRFKDQTTDMSFINDRYKRMCDESSNDSDDSSDPFQISPQFQNEL